MEHKLINGHQAVDLGLPSGALWATCNVGATAQEEFGDYFAWGETTSKTVYSKDNYKYGSDYKLTNYSPNSLYSIVDNMPELDPSDDAATTNWGSDWCIPTRAQLRELNTYCTWMWTSMNGRLGVAPNGNSIFLPAAGCYCNSCLYKRGIEGYYWSSSLYSDQDFAHYYLFDDSFGTTSCFGACEFGKSVRPVLKSSKTFFQEDGFKMHNVNRM